MIVEVWNDDYSTSAFTQGDPNKDIWLGTNPVFVRAIEGEDWDDCMRQHHELMGWEPYKPFEYEEV